jgi:hypothetical protein
MKMSIEAMKQALEFIIVNPPDTRTTRMSRLRNREDAITALRDAIAEQEKCEPVAFTGGGDLFWYRKEDAEPLPDGTKLYTHPAPIPAGWLRAVDEAMVGSHLGIADASDSYEVAKKKLNDLICWNVQVATDPSVNGGYQLVPAEPTVVMLRAGVAARHESSMTVNPIWSAMLQVAPKPGEMK